MTLVFAAVINVFAGATTQPREHSFAVSASERGAALKAEARIYG